MRVGMKLKARKNWLHKAGNPPRWIVSGEVFRVTYLDDKVVILRNNPGYYRADSGMRVVFSRVSPALPVNYTSTEYFKVV
jgi:hypothetical protein